jgi:hypothetical protein
MDAWEAEQLQPWSNAIAVALRAPIEHPLVPSIASRLRAVAGQRLDQLPGVLGLMTREMKGRGLDTRRLEVVDKFLTMFDRLMGG